MSDREETVEHTAGNQGASIPETAASHGTPQPSREPVGVEEMLRIMIEDRKRREEEIADERRRQRGGERTTHGRDAGAGADASTIGKRAGYLDAEAYLRRRRLGQTHSTVRQR